MVLPNNPKLEFFLCTHWGSIRVILGLYRDHGKENGNYYLGFRLMVSIPTLHGHILHVLVNEPDSVFRTIVPK